MPATDYPECLREAFEKGVRAARAGRPRHANEYCGRNYNAEKRRTWDDGWWEEATRGTDLEEAGRGLRGT